MDPAHPNALLFATLALATTASARCQEVTRAEGPPAHVVALRAAPAGYDFELKADLFALYEDGVVDAMLRQGSWRMLATALERSLGFGLDEVDGLHLAGKRDALPDEGAEVVVVLRGTEAVRTGEEHPPTELFDQRWVVIDGRKLADDALGAVGLWSPAPGALVLGDPARLHAAASGAYRGGTPHEDLMVLQAGRPAILQAAWRLDPELAGGLFPFEMQDQLEDTHPLGGRFRVERHDDGSYHLLAALRFQERDAALEPLRAAMQAEIENEAVQTYMRLAAPDLGALRPAIQGNEIRFTKSFEDGDAFAALLTGPASGGGSMLPMLLMTATAQAQVMAAGDVQIVELAVEVEEEPQEDPDADGAGKGKHDHEHNHDKGRGK